MTEAGTPDYGKKMFENIDPKAVLRGVGNATKQWWNEFSPGTMGREHVEAFDRVVGRIKNEELRGSFQDKKELVRWAGAVRGVGMLAIDAALATVPLYLKWKSRLPNQIKYVKKVGVGVRDRVINQKAGSWLLSEEGKKFAENQKDRVLTRLQGIDWWFDFFGGSPRTLKHLETAGKNTHDEAVRQARNIFIDNSNQLTEEGRKAVRKDMIGRLDEFKRGNVMGLTGLASVEAGVFAFRPATKLAKLQLKVGEKVASWVVDHIVNNIVRGGEPAAPTAVSTAAPTAVPSA